MPQNIHYLFYYLHVIFINSQGAFLTHNVVSLQKAGFTENKLVEFEAAASCFWIGQVRTAFLKTKMSYYISRNSETVKTSENN
jgi:hypothetical protein